jgi:hypothetical protein
MYVFSCSLHGVVSRFICVWCVPNGLQLLLHDSTTAASFVKALLVQLARAASAANLAAQGKPVALTANTAAVLRGSAAGQ